MARRDVPLDDWVSDSLPAGVEKSVFDSLVHDLVTRPAEAGVTHAFLVIADGHIVSEWYSEGFSADSTLIS